MYVVVLCGGQSLRMRTHLPDMPKALVEVNGKTLIRHVMQIFYVQGFTEFIINTGYMGHEIVRHFVNDEAAEIYLQTGLLHHQANENGKLLNLIFVSTGTDTASGGRVNKIQDMLKDERNFLLTYVDTLGDIPIQKIIDTHLTSGKTVTLTAIQPNLPYGLLELDGNQAINFIEKPKLKEWINGGFMVMNTNILTMLTENSVLETNLLPNLAKSHQLGVFYHSGIWKGVDNYKDYIELQNDSSFFERLQHFFSEHNN